MSLPRTGMRHSAAVALFALRCLFYDLAHHRKVR